MLLQDPIVNPQLPLKVDLETLYYIHEMLKNPKRYGLLSRKEVNELTPRVARPNSMFRLTFPW